jgi:transposase InsO family protein
VGTSRQNYYKQRTVRRREAIEEALVLALIHSERSRQPMLGGRKLLERIGPELESAAVSLGRDRFFELLRRHDLLILRRRRGVRTTDSRHGFPVYPNLAKGLTPSRPHELLVSDITYIRTEAGFVYLVLVMDAFSRAIVGYDCSDSLEMEGALRALEMALSQRPAGMATIHHSDRGSQYCCRAYIERERLAGVTISMTEENHCYENGKAERLNGTMKREYGLAETFDTKAAAYAAVREGVMLYNHHRPHQALQYRVPMDVHRGASTGRSGPPRLCRCSATLRSGKA